MPWGPAYSLVWATGVRRRPILTRVSRTSAAGSRLTGHSVTRTGAAMFVGGLCQTVLVPGVGGSSPGQDRRPRSGRRRLQAGGPRAPVRASRSISRATSVNSSDKFFLRPPGRGGPGGAGGLGSLSARRDPDRGIVSSRRQFAIYIASPPISDSDSAPPTRPTRRARERLSTGIGP